MSTSLQKAKKSLWCSAFLLVFGMIYEHFSHGVYSAAMVYAFLIPLLCCALPYYLEARRESRLTKLRAAAEELWNAGIAAFTVGCVFSGVLEIYGTTNALIRVYWIAGTVLCAAGLVLRAASRNRN